MAKKPIGEAHGKGEGDVRHLLSDGRRKYFSPQEVADYLDASRSYVYKLIDQGELEALQHGRFKRIARTEILAFEERNRTRSRLVS